MAEYEVTVTYTTESKEVIIAMNEKHAEDICKKMAESEPNGTKTFISSSKIISNKNDLIGRQAMLDAVGQEVIDKANTYNKTKYQAQAPFIEVDNTFFNYKEIKRATSRLQIELPRVNNGSANIYFELGSRMKSRIVIVWPGNNIMIAVAIRKENGIYINKSGHKNYTWEHINRTLSLNLKIQELWSQLDQGLDNMSAREILSKQSLINSD